MIPPVVPQMQRLTSTPEGPSWQSLQPAAQGVGAALLIGAVTAACFWLLKQLWSLIRGATNAKRNGYYRRDRSLGGKTVFIKDEPAQRREVRRQRQCCQWLITCKHAPLEGAVATRTVRRSSTFQSIFLMTRCLLTRSWLSLQSVPLNPFTVGDEQRLDPAREVASPPAVSSPGAVESEEPAWWDLPRERSYVHPRQREQVRS